MIPKKIHYCWFGGKELPDFAKKCIESWKKYCPDYEIIEWNETNFDINMNDYVKEAYKKKKLGFPVPLREWMRDDDVYNLIKKEFNKDIAHELFNNKKFKIDAAVAKNVLVASLPELENLTEWTEEKLHEVTVRIAEKLETKTGQVYTVHRIALSGVSVTPGGSVELADILGKEESLDRIKKCIGWL